MSARRDWLLAGQTALVTGASSDIGAGVAEAFVVEADVSDEDGVADMMRAFSDREDRLDVMVANTGIRKDAPIHEMTLYADCGMSLYPGFRNNG